MSMLDKLKSWLKPPNPESLVRARLDENHFVLSKPDGTTHRMNRHSIAKIAVKTTNAGPFIEDVFWAISDSERTLLLPQASPDFGALLEQFQVLPGFDSKPFVDAMSCTENREFVCWTKM
jgi:hypothetical protein